MTRLESLVQRKSRHDLHLDLAKLTAIAGQVSCGLGQFDSGLERIATAVRTYENALANRRVDAVTGLLESIELYLRLAGDREVIHDFMGRLPDTLNRIHHALAQGVPLTRYACGKVQGVQMLFAKLRRHIAPACFQRAKQALDQLSAVKT